MTMLPAMTTAVTLAPAASDMVVAALAAALAGAVFGLAYLGLLWLAVRRLPRQHGGVAAFLVLGLARLALLLGALWLAVLTGMTAAGLAAALGGFVAVRLGVTRLSGGASGGRRTWT